MRPLLSDRRDDSVGPGAFNTRRARRSTGRRPVEAMVLAEALLLAGRSGAMNTLAPFLEWVLGAQT